MWKAVIIVLILALSLLLTGGCQLVAPDSSHGAVEEKLDEFGDQLLSERWENVSTFFSDNYFQGIEELRDHLERRWLNERLLSLEFFVGRILENDTLTNVQVRWNKTFVDTLGKVKKAAGSSELIFVREEKELKFLSIKGDDFF